MMRLQRRPGEVIRIADNIILTVVSVRGMEVKFSIDAPPGTVIDRQEIRERKDAGLPPRSLRRSDRETLTLPSSSPEFQFSTIFLDGQALDSIEHLHDELAVKLGLPDSYDRNWDALLNCLSSVDDAKRCLCKEWRPRSGRHMVLEIFHYSHDTTDSAALAALCQVIADANSRLRDSDEPIRIWLELSADLS